MSTNRISTLFSAARFPFHGLLRRRPAVEAGLHVIDGVKLFQGLDFLHGLRTAIPSGAMYEHGVGRIERGDLLFKIVGEKIHVLRTGDVPGGKFIRRPHIEDDELG